MNAESVQKPRACYEHTGGFNELSRAGQCVNAKSEKTGDRLDAHSSRGA